MLEKRGEAVLIGKTDRRNAISIENWVANSFTAESALFMPNYSSAIPNSFLTAIALFQECRPAESGCFPIKIWGFPVKIRRLSSWPRYSSTVTNFFPVAAALFQEFCPSKCASSVLKSEANLCSPISCARFQILSLSREMELLFRGAGFLPSRDRALLGILLFAIQACMLNGCNSSPPKS